MTLRLRTPAPHQRSRWFALFAIVVLLTGLASSAVLAHPADAFSPTDFVADDGLADDEPGQKDLTAHAAKEHDGVFYSAWKWDDTSWNGKNTGDACSLFDAGGNAANVDYAVCVTIGTKDATLQSVTVYSCSDGRTDRCTNPVLLDTSTNYCTITNNVAGQFGGLDTQATCNIDAIAAALVIPDLSGGNLLNTCSYPSREPNSDPSDCVIELIVAPVLILDKVVTRDNGGTALERSWTLTATGASSSPTNLSGFGAAGSTDVVSGSSFKPDTYTLAESGSVAGYTNGTTYSCVKTPAGGTANAPVVSNMITLANGDRAVCTITNNDIAPSLTLNKVVTNNTGAAAAAESLWTLTAAGELDPSTDLSGAGAAGSADVVSDANFKADTYTLAESGSVAGYTNGTTYSCVKTPAGGTAGQAESVTSIILAVGDSAICTITNTANLASPTLKTAQGWSLFDTATFTGIRPGAPNANTATVTFKLWTTNTNGVCTGQVGTNRVETISGNVATTSTGIVVNPTTSSTTYYWTADYSGDQYNSPTSSGCGTETTTISFAQPAP